MLSPASKKQVEACRFCWMCRHLCPVQLQTGKEINTPRAKALLLDMMEHGANFDQAMANAMFECLLCDACSNDCATGFEPPLFIREGRMIAAAEGLLPEGVERVLAAIEESGNIYGERRSDFSREAEGDILLFIGDTAALRTPRLLKSYMALLDKAGVRYFVLKDEPSSGAALTDLIGYTEEAREKADACAAAIAASGTKKVVVLDSYDLAAFEQYASRYAWQLDVPFVSAVSFMAELVKAGRVKPFAGEGETVSFHDDARAARVMHEFDDPRFLIEACGYPCVEMYANRKLSKCCGTSLAKAYMPQIVALTAKGRWEDLARTEKTKHMVTSNPQAYEVLSGCVPEGYTLTDLYTLLLAGLSEAE